MRIRRLADNTVESGINRGYFDDSSSAARAALPFSAAVKLRCAQE